MPRIARNEPNREEDRMNTNSKLQHRVLAGAIALAVTACGGGGDGTAPPPPPQAGPVTTDLQAKTLAARSIDALFAYDNMNSEVIVAALAPLPVAAAALQFNARGHRRHALIVGDDGDGDDDPPVLGSGSYPVACASGSATTTFSDTDGDSHVSAGDFATLASTACQPQVDVAWVFGGSVQVDVVGGTNVERHLYYVEVGSADVRVTHAGTPIGGGRTATGVYLISVSNTIDGAPPDQVISVADMAIANADVNLRMTDLSYTVTGSSNIATAAGTFETSVDGIGSVQLALTVKSPLSVDSSTARFRPSAGTVVLTAADFSFEVEYGAADKVTIRIDNAKDGSVDRTVVTNVAALDALLTSK